MRSKVLIATFILILLSGCGKAKQEPELMQASPEVNEESNSGQSKSSNAVNYKIDFNVAKAAGLSANQTKNLEILKKYKSFRNPPNKYYYPIVLPTYIPSGFRIDKFEVANNSYLYDIVYKDNNNYCFLIEAFETSQGGAAGWYSYIEGIDASDIGNNIALGYTEFNKSTNTNQILVNFTLSAELSAEDQTTLGYTSYRLASPIHILGEKDDCEAISVKEAVKIVKSLQFLNPEDSNKNFRTGIGGMPQSW